jgi:hypothetical protein
LVSQLANERLSRDYAEKLHAREITKINEEFKSRQRHLHKKYKKMKRKFLQALEIIEELKREVERARCDKENMES